MLFLVFSCAAMTLVEVVSCIVLKLGRVTVSERINICINVRVSTMAGVSGVASFGAGGIGNNRIMRMPFFLYGRIGSIVATGAGYVCSKSWSSADFST